MEPEIQKINYFQAHHLKCTSLLRIVKQHWNHLKITTYPAVHYTDRLQCHSFRRQFQSPEKFDFLLLVADHLILL